MVVEAAVGKDSWHMAAEGMVLQDNRSDNQLVAVEVAVGNKGSNPVAWVYTLGNLGIHSPVVWASQKD